jgi:acyl carrier protein
MVDLVLAVEEKHNIECPTLMLWLLTRHACGVNLLFSHIRTHSNGRKPLAIVQDKQKETYAVDLVLVVEEKHTIECPPLKLWLLTRQAIMMPVAQIRLKVRAFWI